MTDSVFVALTAAMTSLIVALVSGGFALRNRAKTNQNTDEIQNLKGAIDRDLERLRAKLLHGQTVSAAQWSVEFAAYQKIWEGIVEVKPELDKLVNRDREIGKIGLPKEHFNEQVRLHYRQEITHHLVSAADRLLNAIHNNAPFYPASIRDAANEAHKTTVELITKNLHALAAATVGSNIAETEKFYLENVALLNLLVEQVNNVESLIRNRLEAVRVVNPVVV